MRGMSLAFISKNLLTTGQLLSLVFFTEILIIVSLTTLSVKEFEEL